MTVPCVRVGSVVRLCLVLRRSRLKRCARFGVPQCKKNADILESPVEVVGGWSTGLRRRGWLVEVGFSVEERRRKGGLAARSSPAHGHVRGAHTLQRQEVVDTNSSKGNSAARPFPAGVVQPRDSYQGAGGMLILEGFQNSIGQGATGLALGLGLLRVGSWTGALQKAGLTKMV